MAFDDSGRKFEDGDDVRRWLDPVVRVLSRTKRTSARQKLLQYGAVLHAMIGTPDPNHRVAQAAAARGPAHAQTRLPLQTQKFPDSTHGYSGPPHLPASSDGKQAAYGVRHPRRARQRAVLVSRNGWYVSARLEGNLHKEPAVHFSEIHRYIWLRMRRRPRPAAQTGNSRGNGLAAKTPDTFTIDRCNTCEHTSLSEPSSTGRRGRR